MSNTLPQLPTANPIKKDPINQGNLLTISQAAKLLNINPITLRRWETRGYFTPSRTAGGKRRYTPTLINQLKHHQSTPPIIQTTEPVTINHARSNNTLTTSLVTISSLALVLTLLFLGFTAFQYQSQKVLQKANPGYSKSQLVLGAKTISPIPYSQMLSLNAQSLQQDSKTFYSAFIAKIPNLINILFNFLKPEVNIISQPVETIAQEPVKVPPPTLSQIKWLPQNTLQSQIIFKTPKTTANYAISITPNWPTQTWVTNKTTSGFTVNFTGLSPTNATIDWIIIE